MKFQIEFEHTLNAEIKYKYADYCHLQSISFYTHAIPTCSTYPLLLRLCKPISFNTQQMCHESKHLTVHFFP